MEGRLLLKLLVNFICLTKQIYRYDVVYTTVTISMSFSALYFINKSYAQENMYYVG